MSETAPNPESATRPLRWDRNRHPHPRNSRRSPVPRQEAEPTSRLPEDAAQPAASETEVPEALPISVEIEPAEPPVEPVVAMSQPATAEPVAAERAVIIEPSATTPVNRLLSTGFIAGLVLAFTALVLAAVLAFAFQRTALTSMDAYLRSDAYAHASPASAQQAISVRLILFRYALLAGGILAGLAFGFLGFSLLLAAQPDNIRTRRSRIKNATPGLATIVLSTGLISVCIGFRPPTEIETVGNAESTLLSAGALATPPPATMPAPAIFPSPGPAARAVAAAKPSPSPTATPKPTPSPAPTPHPIPHSTPAPTTRSSGWGRQASSRRWQGRRRSRPTPAPAPHMAAPEASARAESAPSIGSAGNPDIGL